MTVVTDRHLPGLLLAEQELGESEVLSALILVARKAPKTRRIHQRDTHLGFSVWNDMVRRVTDTGRRKSKAYAFASICEDWYEFEKFSAWYVGYTHRKEGWVLDKDLLGNGSKIYSPETCCFIPHELNQMMVSCRVDSKGMPGVFPVRGKFCARVRARNVQHHIGTYETPDQAYSAYLDAKSSFLVAEAEKHQGDLPPAVMTAIRSFKFGAEPAKGGDGEAEQ